MVWFDLRVYDLLKSCGVHAMGAHNRRSCGMHFAFESGWSWVFGRLSSTCRARLYPCIVACSFRASSITPYEEISGPNGFLKGEDACNMFSVLHVVGGGIAFALEDQAI